MISWETLLEVSWPKNACDQSGECCRGAAQVAPWARILRQAAEGETMARNFLSLFVPYTSQEEARAQAPDAVFASLQLAEERGDALEEVVFYRCRYLKGKNQCQVYEDRPQLCRDYPESPFGVIPKCCGYAAAKQGCLDKLAQMKAELAYYQELQQQRGHEE